MLQNNELKLIAIHSHHDKSEKDNYRLRIWLSDKAIEKGGKYSVEVDIHAIAK